MSDNSLSWLGQPDGCYRIGRLGKPHGVKGEISFQVDDDVFDRLDSDFVILDVDGLPVPFFFEEYRFKSDDMVLAKFEGVDTEEAARRLTGCGVYFPREAADTDDQVSNAEIVGYSVIDAVSHETVGTIHRVDASTENVLLEVTTADGRLVLLPINEHLLDDVDKETRSVSLRIPEGLLDL